MRDHIWHWEQGRLNYFQFDELRKIAKFAVTDDLRTADRSSLVEAVGLPFPPNNPEYKPWRNYGRAFQLAMIAVPSPKGNGSEVTEIGKLLAEDGKITTDEYMHFWAQAITDPSPALSDWSHDSNHRYPLLFSLRFLLARASQGKFSTNIAAILTAYSTSNFRGDEDWAAFLEIIHKTYPKNSNAEFRQAAESLKVMSQLSYLSSTKDSITVSLAKEDAEKLFADLKPIGGTRSRRGGDEIMRVAGLYPNAIAELNFDYPATVVSDVEEAGFSEGGRVRRTHIITERNSRIRRAFFAENPSTVCDFCGMDTAENYPWTPKVLDVHHLLPLCSGARTSKTGTLLNDLVANCPTCHRAVHRYYDKWLLEKGHQDFVDAGEARGVYNEAKQEHKKTAVSHV